MKIFWGVTFTLLLTLLFGAAREVQAQNRSVLRTKTITLSTRDSSNRRFVCDGSVTPPRIGVLKSQSKTLTVYSRATAGSLKKRATTECKRKVAQRLCGDSLDNDGDGLIDFPADTECQSLVGNSESAPNPVPTIAATPIPPSGSSPLALFRSPLNSTFAISNFFDHDVPEEFVDANGYSRISSGEVLLDNLDGHQGYDFDVPTGTPVVAVGDGEVEYGGLESPFFCPLLNKSVSGNFVRIRHDTSEGIYYSVYVHLSRVDVTSGQVVAAGTVLGLSGNTGCSTGPHLHFDIRRPIANNQVASVDPFGWTGSDSDPWTLKPNGLESRFLWKTGKAPEIFRELRSAPNPGTGDAAPITVTAIRSMGFNDQTNPNNEFFELQLDPRFTLESTISLDGYYILNDKNDRYNFPAGSSIALGNPLLVRTGAGTNSATTLYMNLPSGFWDNEGDCVRLFRPNGFRLYYLFYGPKGCTGVSGTRRALSESTNVRDITGPSLKQIGTSAK